MTRDLPQTGHGTLQKHLAVSKPDHPEAGFRPLARRLVKTVFFDYCMSGVLVLNAVIIGVQAEYQARVGSTTESSAYFQSIEGVFGFIFAFPNRISTRRFAA